MTQKEDSRAPDTTSSQLNIIVNKYYDPEGGLQFPRNHLLLGWTLLYTNIMTQKEDSRAPDTSSSRLNIIVNKYYDPEGGLQGPPHQLLRAEHYGIEYTQIWLHTINT